MTYTLLGLLGPVAAGRLLTNDGRWSPEGDGQVEGARMPHARSGPVGVVKIQGQVPRRAAASRRSHARLTTLLVLAVLAVLVCTGCGAKLSDHGVRLNDGKLEYGLALCDYERLVAVRVEGPAGWVDVDVADATQGPGLAVVDLLEAADLSGSASARMRLIVTIGRDVVEWEGSLTFRLDEIPDSDDSWLAGDRRIKKDDQMRAHSCWKPEDR